MPYLIEIQNQDSRIQNQLQNVWLFQDFNQQETKKAKLQRTFFTKREEEMKGRDSEWTKLNIKEHMQENMDSFMNNEIKNDDWLCK